MKTANKEFAIPTGLSRKGRKAAQTIVKTAKEVFGPDVSTGGCVSFYSPKEWAERGESYGQNSELIVVYDGGDLRYLMSLDAAYDMGSYEWTEKMREALSSLGLFAEECTCWYSAVYCQ